ncbi:hypothetical protein B5C26_10160 [Photorhabdus luminescens]|uniref:hypothetical protein n=1 Tax=Photorhabdus luminescens TaxID=29488 RepID=UPI000B4C583E|nr:hypothetical protein [Photorhabdus luminescens]OWO82360.1 hypothetical protein B5C26_10160 [Photorhabdus luminescens]
MLKIHCGSFRTISTKKGNVIEIDNGNGDIVIYGNTEDVFNSTTSSFNEIKEYFENRGYKIEAL